MIITAGEKQMYAVMKAIYDSGIPISFKGSMVLKACLLEAGYTENTRNTADIDANWYSETEPSSDQIIKSLKDALRNSGIRLNINLFRMHGKGRSAGFELSDPDTEIVLFTMDMDINRSMQPTRIYSVDGFVFRGISPAQILADKLSVISSEKVFRRIKDIVDLYYLSQIMEFDKKAVLHALDVGGKSLGNFRDFLQEYDALQHAYEKFRFSGSLNNPAFENVYKTVKEYIRDVLPADTSEAEGE